MFGNTSRQERDQQHCHERGNQPEQSESPGSAFFQARRYLRPNAATEIGGWFRRGPLTTDTQGSRQGSRGFLALRAFAQVGGCFGGRSRFRIVEQYQIFFC